MRKLSDTSLIVSWCTEEHGLIKTIAKGARGPKSPFAGKLDLFVEAELVWARSRSSELHRLQEVTVCHYRQGLRGNYHRTVVAAYFGELVERAVEGEHAEPEVYDLLVRGLDFLAEGGEGKRALPHFEKELSRLLGIGTSPGYASRLEEVLHGGFPASRREARRLVHLE